MVGAWFWRWAVILIGLSVPSLAHAQVVQLTVVSPDLEVGDVGLVRVRVQGPRPTAPPVISTDPPQGLRLAFYGQSQQVRVVNGQSARSFEYNYRVEALAEGTYRLGPAVVEFGTRSESTRPGTLRVRPRSGGSSAEVEASSVLSVEQAWTGQVVLLQRRLRSKSRILRDSWTEPVLRNLDRVRGTQPRFVEYQVDNNGQRTFVREESYPLMVAPGEEAEISATVARVGIRSQSGSLSAFSVGRSKQVIVPLDAYRIQVRDLPSPPPQFSGLVGDFSIQVKVDKTAARVGDSVNQEILIQGDGDLVGFEPAAMPSSDKFRVYEGTPAISSRVDGDGFKAEGMYSRVIVPTKAGRLSIPDYTFVYFSPTKGEYVKEVVSFTDIEVGAGASKNGAFESFMSDTDALPVDGVPSESLDEGVRPIQTAGVASTVPEPMWLRWAGWLATLPLVSFVLVRVGPSVWGVAGRGVSRLFRRQAAEESINGLLQALPEDRVERLGALERVLRRVIAALTELESTGAIDGAQVQAAREVRARLDRARFAEVDDPTLEQDIRSLASQLERLT